MNTLPKEYIDTKIVPLSELDPKVEYPIYYDDLSLGPENCLWVKRSLRCGAELEEYEHEYEQVYLSRSEEGKLTVRIPTTFSKRRKWSRYDWMDQREYIRIDEIIVGD